MENNCFRFGTVPSLVMIEYRKAFLRDKVGTLPSVAQNDTRKKYRECGPRTMPQTIARGTP